MVAKAAEVCKLLPGLWPRLVGEAILPKFFAFGPPGWSGATIFHQLPIRGGLAG
jgi:hypothetical protein